MSETPVDYSEAQSAVNEALADAVRAFARWAVANWQLEGQAVWESRCVEPYPGDQYLAGYNAAVSQMRDAADCFLEDEGHRS